MWLIVQTPTEDACGKHSSVWRSHALWLLTVDQAVKLCAGCGVFGRVTEEPVLYANDKRPDGTFGCVVIDRVQRAFQLAPVAGLDALSVGFMERLR